MVFYNGFICDPINNQQTHALKTSIFHNFFRFFNVRINDNNVIGSEFIQEFELTEFNNVEISWTDDLELNPSLYDCSFDDGMNGFDCYAICLKNNLMPNDKSLVFYNNESTSEGGILGLYNFYTVQYPGFDTSFSIDSKKLKNIYDEIIFFIGRPKNCNPNCSSWIDHEKIEKFKHEKCTVDSKLISSNGISYNTKSIVFEYNKYGAMSLFCLKDIDNKWVVEYDQKLFKDGLSEILSTYYKQN